MTEIAILTAIQEWRTPMLDTVFTGITSLGDKGALWILLGVILLCTKKYRKQGLLLLFCLLASLLVGNILLKNLIQRDRPCWLYPEVELLIANPTDFSFPSAHSMSSFAAATALWLTNRRFGIGAFITAAAIAFSRMYLFVHWPSDVAVGSAVGILIAVLVFGAAKRWTEREGQNDENV